MPKDDYLNAKRRDIARRATAAKGYHEREQHRQRAKRKRVSSLSFPDHEFVRQPDGTILSKQYVFQSSRWDS